MSPEHPPAPSVVPSRDHRGHLRPSAARRRQPAERAADDGLDVRRRRRRGVRPLRQPDLVGLRAGARRPRGRSVPGVLLRPGRGRDDPRPGRAGRQGGRAAARLQRQHHADRRPRGPRPDHARSWSTSPTPRRSSKACDDAALVWLESPTNPALEVADIPPIVAAAHEAGAYVVVDNTFATPAAPAAAVAGRRPRRALGDQVHRRAQRRAARRGGDRATTSSYDVLKKRRDMIGATPGTFETWLALRGLRTLHVRLERAQANAQELVRRLGEHPAVGEVRYPGLRRDRRRSCSREGALAADLLTHKTQLWVHATSLGGVESTFERRRRWKTEPATIPDGLVRHVGRHRGRRRPLGRPGRRPRRPHAALTRVSPGPFVRSPVTGQSRAVSRARAWSPWRSAR